MRHLLSSTCVASLIVTAIATAAGAETVIDTKRTTPIATFTAKGGSRDDVRVGSAGSIVVASGAAVTLDSANAVRNEGTVQITDADGSAGIVANSGMSGNITNSGKLTIDETYAPTDADKDGDLDGSLARGSRRFGIRTAGAFAGAIANSGAITVEGNDSAGIQLEGPLTGSLASSGSIAVAGDRSFGVRAGNISGNVALTGTVNVQGLGSIGVALDGDVTGGVVVQGAVAASGYRATTPPSDVTKLDADDLLQGGPAVRIAGNVSGGILFDAPPGDLDPKSADEDKDGVDDAKEGTASVTAFGAAPAVQVGAAARDISVGAIGGSSTGYGIVVNGGIAGAGVYKGIDANGLTIGGLGGAVTVANGAAIAGSVSAASNGGNATALRVGAMASVPEIRASGSISASGGSSATSQVNALLIEAGANVTAVRTSGAVRAVASDEGSAAAIADRSGTVRLIENAGSISASAARTGFDRAMAIDLGANTTGATIRQPAAVKDATAPAITGNILLGAGDDLFEVADGTISGATRFGGGTNRLALSGDASYLGDVTFGAGNDVLVLAGTSGLAGNVDFGGGADSLTIAGTGTLRGSIANSAGMSVTVTGGNLDLTNRGVVQLTSLTLGSKGAMAVNIDAAGGTSTLYQVSGSATFEQGSKVVVNLASVGRSEGRYVVVRAGSLVGGAALTSVDATLPFMFKSTLSSSDAAREITLDIRRKTVAELDLNRSQGSIFPAVYAALDSDAKVAGAFLDIVEGERFRAGLRQMLPDHAGGAFDTVTQASRATGRILADPRAPFADQGRWGFWLQQVAVGTSKSVGDSAGYNVTGWGASGGAEAKTDGAGNFGLSLGYMHGDDEDLGTDNEVSASQYELAAYWRGDWGPLHAFARASAAHIDFSGTRRFEGAIGQETVKRETGGKWDGRLWSASGGASYEWTVGRFSLRPVAAVDYYRLKEDAYLEAGGGKAFDLAVASRISDEVAASGTIAAGLNFGGAHQDAGWFRVEVEGGRREIVGGALGATTAHFTGGKDFTLLPEDRANGWIGKLRLLGGNAAFTVGGEFNAEEQQGRAALAARASVQMAM